MHRSISRFTVIRIAALLMCCLMFLNSLGHTLAYVIQATPSLLNTFLSGLEPEGLLNIHKEVQHPFGGGYTIPDTLEFPFIVSLGQEAAGESFTTSAGKLQADEKGDLTVAVKPGASLQISGIPIDTQVTVTEIPLPGFTPDQLSQSATIIPGETTLIFRNIYAPEPASGDRVRVEGVKLLEGRPWQEGDRFTLRLEYKAPGEEGDWTFLEEAEVAYTLIEIQDPEYPEDPEKTIWVPMPDFDKFSFTDAVQQVPFTQAGTYSFRITEVKGTIGGIDYEKDVACYFDIRTGDTDMDGQLEIQDTKAWANAETGFDAANGIHYVDLTVTNTYAPAGTTEAVVVIQKILDDQSGSGKTAEGFTFELYDENGNLIATSPATSAAGETRITLTFDAKHVGTTFFYTLKETNAGENISGLRYDDEEYSICVTVTDNLDGTIRALIYEKPSPEDVPDEPEIPNIPEQTEAAEEETTQSVPEETEPVQAEVMPEPTEPQVTEPEATEAEADPAAISPPADAGSVYTAAFKNRYDPIDAVLVLQGEKNLEGQEQKGEEFSFVLYETGDSFVVPQGAEAMQTVPNNANGTFSFRALTFDRVGTYRYVIRELPGSLPGIIYDSTQFQLLVTVTDAGGSLSAQCTITDQLGTPAQLIFTNRYAPKPVRLAIQGTKTLEGKDMTDGMFGFLLFAADEDYKTQGEAIRKTKSDAEGNFRFDELEFKESGSFYFVVREDIATEMEGVTFDTSEYCIRVIVTDLGDGTLAAEADLFKNNMPIDAIRFENIWEEPSTETTDETTAPTEPPDETTEPSDPEDDTTEPSSPTGPTEPGSTPGTGDRQIWFHVASMCVSLTGMIMLLFLMRKTKGRYDT